MQREPRWRIFKDPWSSTTHFAGFWLALLAELALVSRAAGDLPRTRGMAIYLLGLLIYSSHWPNPWPGRFGHHEIWHLFVLIGAGAHYALTWTLAGRSFPPF
jgi:hemolysin III